MKSKLNLGVVAGAILSLGVMSAAAIPSTYELGSVDPGSPANGSHETTYLTTLIGGYNSGSSSFSAAGHAYVVAPGSYVPPPLLSTSVTIDANNAGQNGGQTALYSFTISAGDVYAMVKWGDVNEFYYVAGLTGTVTVANDVNSLGESHYDTWTATRTAITVPDGGNTALLLGSVFLGFMVVARRVRTVRA